MRGALLSAALGAMVAAGCGSESGPPPAPVHPVTGTVTYNGQPVVGADITFSNQAENRSAFGRTNDRGEYQLTTFSMNDGAVAGKHIVTIVKIETPPAPKAQPDVESTQYVPPGLGEDTSPPPAKSTFPEKFSNRETSGLVAVVNADAPNTIDFDLKD